jgi:small subunit ribosomal protein S20
MPQHKSAIKRVRQTIRRRNANRMKRSKLRTLFKKVLVSENKTDAEPVLREAVSYIDRMAKVGIIHKNNAANKKARLTKFVNKLA